MDGSLYAGIGDLRDPEIENPKTPGAQVLRLDSPTSGWVEDKDFNEPLPYPPGTTNKNYLAISILGTAHFDHDSASNPIAPVDVLMAGFWSLGKGLTIFEKTVLTGSVGGKGKWTQINLVPPTQPLGQVRSFASYKDSVTHVEMAFAGGDSYGIFSGAFNSATGVIQWSATGEAGTTDPSCPPSSWECNRVTSFARCGGKLYAAIYDAIAVRTDGANPSWQTFYQYSGPPLYPQSSGFRGLHCVPNLNGEGSMLIAALEGLGNIYDIPLNGSQPTIELYTSNYLSSQLGTWVGLAPPPPSSGPVCAAFNNMIVYPQSGSTGCPDLLIGVVAYTPQYANAYKDYYPTAQFLVRHCNGFYHLRKISDPSITPAPPLRATRALALSEFSGDPAGTLYSGGYVPITSAHNTDWVYRGVPR
jgi:hypothetical protein